METAVAPETYDDCREIADRVGGFGTDVIARAYGIATPFDEKVKIIDTFADAYDLWGETDEGSDDEEVILVKALELATTIDDLRKVREAIPKNNKKLQSEVSEKIAVYVWQRFDNAADFRNKLMIIGDLADDDSLKLELLPKLFAAATSDEELREVVANIPGGHDFGAIKVRNQAIRKICELTAA